MILTTVNSNIICQIYCWETGVHYYGYQKLCHRTSHIHPAVIQCRQQDHIFHLRSELWLPYLWPPQPSWFPLNMSDSYGLITAPVVSQSKYGHFIASCIFHEALAITSWAKLSILFEYLMLEDIPYCYKDHRGTVEIATLNHQTEPLPVLMIL